MLLAAKAEVRIGYIAGLSSDAGKSGLRGVEIAIEEINEAGGLKGEKLKLYTADTRQDPTEGIKAYEYLAEKKKVDFIVSSSIDDVSLAWLPRFREYKTPTLDTWTSYIGIIDEVGKDYDNMKNYVVGLPSRYIKCRTPLY